MLCLFGHRPFGSTLRLVVVVIVVVVVVTVVASGRTALFSNGSKQGGKGIVAAGCLLFLLGDNGDGSITIRCCPPPLKLLFAIRRLEVFRGSLGDGLDLFLGGSLLLLFGSTAAGRIFGFFGFAHA